MAENELPEATGGGRTLFMGDDVGGDPDEGLEAASGNGYSNRVELMAYGVPTICEGE